MHAVGNKAKEESSEDGRMTCRVKRIFDVVEEEMGQKRWIRRRVRVYRSRGREARNALIKQAMGEVESEAKKWQKARGPRDRERQNM